jgi:hypothetical protein
MPNIKEDAPGCNGGNTVFPWLIAVFLVVVLRKPHTNFFSGNKYLVCSEHIMNTHTEFYHRAFSNLTRPEREFIFRLTVAKARARPPSRIASDFRSTRFLGAMVAWANPR